MMATQRAVVAVPVRPAAAAVRGRTARRLRAALPVAVGVVLLGLVWELAGWAGLAGSFVLTPGAALRPLLDPVQQPAYASGGSPRWARAGCAGWSRCSCPAGCGCWPRG
jgi:hypothetical protein